jgi:hypothetical protein
LSLQAQLAAVLVHTLYLDAFRQQAAYLFDHTAVEQAAEVFWRNYVPDERMPASPTRR